MLDIRLRDVPSQLMVTEQRTVDQAELVEWLPGAMSRVSKAAGGVGGVLRTASLPFLLRAEHPDEPVFVVIYEGNPNEGPVPVEVCAPIGDQAEPTTVATRRVPAHREAYVRLTKEQTVPTSKIGLAYAAVEEWVSTNKLETIAAPREVYYTDFHAAAPDDDVFDVAWVIR
jgi:effector-binding domain-containing protein